MRQGASGVRVDDDEDDEEDPAKPQGDHHRDTNRSRQCIDSDSQLDERRIYYY